MALFCFMIANFIRLLVHPHYLLYLNVIQINSIYLRTINARKIYNQFIWSSFSCENLFPLLSVKTKQKMILSEKTAIFKKSLGNTFNCIFDKLLAEA